MLLSLSNVDNYSMALYTSDAALQPLIQCIYAIHMQLSKSNREAYCQQHSYPLIDGTGWFLKDKVRGLQTLAYYSWMKIEFACAMMERYRNLHWLFWIDTDALFMNKHVRLEELLAGVQESDLFIVGADAEGINAGTFFIRNSPAGRKFCMELLDQQRTYGYEQQAMSSLYNKAVKESGQECVVSERDNLRLPSGVKACLDKKALGFRILKLCAFGSWAGLEWKRGHGYYFDGVYMDGDFIIHFPGDRSAKLGLMRKALSWEGST